MTVLVPDVDRTNLNAIIYEELCLGIVREPSRQTYVAAIERLRARGAEAVILGCTEIAMLIDDAVSPLPGLRHHRSARQGAGFSSPGLTAPPSAWSNPTPRASHAAPAIGAVFRCRCRSRLRHSL